MHAYVHTAKGQYSTVCACPHMYFEFPAAWVASTLHCHSVSVLANTVLAWQLSLWIRCVLTGAKWQEGNQTVHIYAGGFTICVPCWCFCPTRPLWDRRHVKSYSCSSGKRPAYEQDFWQRINWCHWSPYWTVLIQWVELVALCDIGQFEFLKIMGRSNPKTDCTSLQQLCKVLIPELCYKIASEKAQAVVSNWQQSENTVDFKQLYLLIHSGQCC